ncbi:Multicopper oxidase [Rubrivivax sp. A210]|uniref:multicopper oxidase family protein n=1 Tax=Rubrivivax sp. A210 TaxID=2772301 RepID=UPI00191AC438|nr:multicopper oxidase family protein [Rubrivivax sp. A210]CAD5369272.1 Multicopper oxidase [Rubrivivax sp. A210]
MQLNRRHFIQAAGAIALPGTAFAAAAAANPRELTMDVFKQRVRPGGAATEVWGFNGSVPGPVLRYAQGDKLDLHVVNRLKQPTTVHWHGMRVPNAMDGVPQVTQAPIEPGAAFDYRYTIEDAGTYWYHPHQSSFEQVPRGLYGALIVDEQRPLPVDRDIVWLLADYKLDERNAQVEDYGRVADFGARGRHGNVITINGTAAGAGRTLPLRPNERVRLRLINGASARIFRLEFGGHAPWIIAHDGQAVPPHPIGDGGLLFLAPGQRTDLVLDGNAGSRKGGWAITDRRGQGSEIARIVYAGKPVRARALGQPQALEPNRHTEVRLESATQHFLMFEGGEGGMPAIGQVDGKALKVEDIRAQHGLTWTMNYSAQHEHAMMHEPLFYMRKGEHVQLRMINNTLFEHPMHLHGHFFRVLALDGKPNPLREWRDTVLLGPQGSVDIAFVAENPGEWMFHCHVLDHAAGGMMGTVAVFD